MDKDTVVMGPYRATKLWNEVVRTFRHGMPVSRHRRYMKSYEECFTATEAIDWLHAQLQINPNFGPTVSRAQTLQLLEKFQKSRIFEEVRAGKRPETIADNGRLYRFTLVSPAKARTPARMARPPLATRSTLLNTTTTAVPPTKLSFEKVAPSAVSTIPDCHMVANNTVSQDELDDVWKTMTLDSLQRALHLHSLEDILDSDYVNAQYIMHNMKYVNHNGVVCNIDRREQLPYWVLSAMRCLAHWPNKIEENLPDYPGFEKDVFKVVKDYFEGLSEPLLTFSMYEVFTNVFVCAENAGRSSRSTLKSAPPPSSIQAGRGGFTSFASVENLLMDLTMNGQPTDDDGERLEEPEEEEQEPPPPPTTQLNRAFHPARSCDPRVSGMQRPTFRRCVTARDLHKEGSHVSYASTRSLALASRTNLKRCPSTTSMPLCGDRLETSFGVDSSEPRTHVVTADGERWRGDGDALAERPVSAAGYQHQFPRRRHPSSASIETRYGADETFLQQEDKCLSSNDLSRVPPCPENGLARQHSRSSRLNVPDGGRGGYGYTVVLSTTPRREVGMSRWRRQSESTESSHYGSRESYNRHDHSQANLIYTDHDYYKRPPPVPPRSSRCPAPPPYVPPPSYGSVHRATSSMDSSHSSSYETAPESMSATPEDSVESVFVRGSLSPVSRQRVKEGLRFCCLLLPPANRRKLHLLLRLMVKMAENPELHMDNISTRELVHRTFTRCILRSAEEADFDEVLALRIVSFMMDNYAEVMMVPDDLKLQIEERILYLRRSKVSVEEYERQKLTNSQQALNDLLEGIIKDNNMAAKEKKRRLKQFQKSHPDLYARRFPTVESEEDLIPQKPRLKPALLSRPLLKLKSFRI